MATDLVLSSVAGPDAGWSVRLPEGLHWVGRSTTGVTLADPAVEAHHALISIDRDGRVDVFHVAGRSVVRVDGRVASGWAPVRSGAAVELGNSRLIAGVAEMSVPRSSGRVYAPLGEAEAELARFERDLRAAVAAELVRRDADRSPAAVVLGEGRCPVAVDVRDAADRPIAMGRLSLAAQRIADDITSPVAPVVFDLDRTARLGISAPDPRPVVAAIVDQLAPTVRAGVIVATADEAAPFASATRPVIVVAPDRGQLPCWSTAVLDVGATWRATWQPEVLGHPDRTVRLHARGRVRSAHVPSQARPAMCASAAGRSSLSR